MSFDHRYVNTQWLWQSVSIACCIIVSRECMLQIMLQKDGLTWDAGFKVTDK